MLSCPRRVALQWIDVGRLRDQPKANLFLDRVFVQMAGGIWPESVVESWSREAAYNLHDIHDTKIAMNNNL